MKLLNTLYIQTQGSYLRLEHDTLKIDVEGKTVKQLPLHHFSGIVVFGNVLMSPFLVARCAEDGRGVVWLSRSGRFQARLSGPVSGNVLLRRAQHAAVDQEPASVHIARMFVAGKLHNARNVLLRAAREGTTPAAETDLRRAAAEHAYVIRKLPRLTHLDEVRGAEGDAARHYFGAFDHLIRTRKDAFTFRNRTRRPPLDPVNALLSFLYSLLRSECASACESVGLDPQMGFLHALRPGRPALALDLMEELRAPIADRLALTLINRAQLRPEDFTVRVGGAVSLSEDARKLVLIEYQKRKQDEVLHPVLKQNVPLGLVPHVQARLLARHLRGDVPEYTPFILR